MKRRTAPVRSPAPAPAPAPAAPRPAARLAAPAVLSPMDDRLGDLVEALGALRTAEERRRFLVDLCTPAELEAMADRWAVVPALAEGRAYRDIHDRTGVSVTTIGRVARCLALGSGGYRVAAERLGHLAPGAALSAPSGRDAAIAATGLDDAH